MKKAYVAPNVEKITFYYRGQVVAASVCRLEYINKGGGSQDTCGGNEHSANRVYFN